MNKFNKLINTEISHINTKFPNGYSGLHEFYGLLIEEIRELEQEIFKKPKNRSNKKIIAEAIQIISLIHIMIASL